MRRPAAALAAALAMGLAARATGATGAARDLDREYARAAFRLGGVSLRAYLADTDAKREVGLMNVDALPADFGMLFVFPSERPLAFWMKNTRIPLAIGFFDRASAMVDAQEMAVPSPVPGRRPPTYPSRKPARLALEMEKGWIARHAVKTGAGLCRVGATASTATNDAVPPCP